ncbi:PucR family transcriptional regulator [Cytobacillus oceanisediminis]|uniref:PucR family transcriptional regulator n=1 Tax=Niallia alba TaxID=2729105 RepID=A0A7Y0PNI6_9BACI|nr:MULTISPECIES: PucR family transcriptional regulator [Bacillaceae]MBQ6446019.1 PucR family transcriptional regulator [Bacillus sp. (in: firmicutes)]MBZ9534103.1 PucR family transcriptional regulator [Cytobacillus oceanisediminis]NMO79142.1 PucR family transcriptional regulator [Niallia alba]UTI42485.1 PucR family transcriptional regulator [Niallia sp. RD1]
MKLAEILQKPVFDKVEVIAGHTGLNKEIKHITMMDAPDIVDYLNPNDLLVTTAYHLKDKPGVLLSLIKSMQEKDCTALGIKSKRFLGHIPNEAIQFANDKGFPLLEIPLETSLGEIVNASLNYMLSQRTAELTTAFETHRKFTQHILKGKGIKRLVDDLSHMINKRIVLFDAHFQLHTSSYNRNSIENFFSSLHTSGFEFLLPNSPYSYFSSRNTEEVFTIFPIYTHMKKPAFLVVLGEIPLEDQSLLLTIEQATNVLSFELMRENTVKQYTRRARNDFFTHFVEGKFTFAEEIESRAKEFSLKREQASIAIIGKMDSSEQYKSFTQHSVEIDYIYEFLETEIKKAPFASQLFIKDDHCILIMEVVHSSYDLDSSILPYLQNIQSYIANTFKRHMSLGISNVYQQLLNLPNAYREALSALHTGNLSGNTPFIQIHRPKDVFEMLRIIPTKDLLEFYDHIFQAFSSNHQQDEEQILLNTLSVYLETHCQISETAKRLYVHRNTVIYRLEKCEELLGKSLKDPETTFHLRFAFRIKSILKTNERKKQTPIY